MLGTDQDLSLYILGPGKDAGIIPFGEDLRHILGVSILATEADPD